MAITKLKLLNDALEARKGYMKNQYKKTIEESNESRKDILNDPTEYEKLNTRQKEVLQEWITECVKPHRTQKYNSYHSSYGLKHVFDKGGGFYVTNGQFKGAMLTAGFPPEDSNKKNWVFKIGKRAGTKKN